MLGKLTDMARTPDEVKDEASPVVMGSTEKYPWGLRISLTHDELETLGVDYSDWEVGSMFHLHVLAKVTSISANETENGNNCCVGLQITHIAGMESEDEENEEAEPSLEKHGYLRYK